MRLFHLLMRFSLSAGTHLPADHFSYAVAVVTAVSKMTAKELCITKCLPESFELRSIILWTQNKQPAESNDLDEIDVFFCAFPYDRRDDGVVTEIPPGKRAGVGWKLQK